MIPVRCAWTTTDMFAAMPAPIAPTPLAGMPVSVPSPELADRHFFGANEAVHRGRMEHALENVVGDLRKPWVDMREIGERISVSYMND